MKLSGPFSAISRDKMMNVPDFFIIGAPKCGTTSLSRWLSSHPDVFFSSPKEPFFFDEDISSRFKFDEESYSALFDGARDGHKVLGEGSTTYAYSDVAVDNILKVNPGAKFIFLFRDPVRMAPALHEQELFALHEDVSDFSQAWALQEKRVLGKWVPRSCSDKKKLMYREICSLGSQLKKLEEKTDDGQLFWASLDEMLEDPRKLYLRVLDFLGLDDDGRVEFLNENPSKEVSSRTLQFLILLAVRIRKSLGINRGFGFSKVNVKARERKKVSRKMEEILIKELQPERDILFNLTGIRY